MGLVENLEQVRTRIAAACARAHRPVDSVTLVAVSKGQPPEVVSQAAALGLGLFGENRVQEARTKKLECSGKLRWHMIGHLQSNKARDAVQVFDMIESVDSLALAEELHRRAAQAARTLPILLQVNVAGESTKSGYSPERVLGELAAINQFAHLEIHGLMTIAPWSADPEKVRPVFRRLRELREQCEQRLGAPLRHLSMGMSGDFEVAIEEGATLIRVGTALFGARSKFKKNPAADD